MSDKPKCPVFGCTIPRGIPHEHPAGVSAVMRDPVAPLNADERAELESYRAAAENDFDEDAKRLREGLLFQARSMQCVAPGSPLYDRAMGTNYYVKPADAPMIPGRKLRDSLMMAGQNMPQPDVDYMSFPFLGDVPVTRAKCPPLVRTVGRFMAWIFGAIGVASILILSAMTAGWL